MDTMPPSEGGGTGSIPVEGKKLNISPVVWIDSKLYQNIDFLI